jgi:hypothetical protein
MNTERTQIHDSALIRYNIVIKWMFDWRISIHRTFNCDTCLVLLGVNLPYPEHDAKMKVFGTSRHLSLRIHQ